jgi:hypothetical protein
VADGAVVLDGALALDGRVEGGVVVDVRAVRGGACAGVAADVPCRRSRLAELGKHRVHRRRCKPKEGGFTFALAAEMDRLRPRPLLPASARDQGGAAVIGRPGIGTRADTAEPAKAKIRVGPRWWCVDFFFFVCVCARRGQKGEKYDIRKEGCRG